MKHAEEGKWTVSTDEEIFNDGLFFSTKEEAIEGGKIEFTWEGECPSLFVGQVKSLELQMAVNVDSIIENIAENVYDEAGEVAEDYLNDVKKEHAEELESDLNEVLLNWINKHNYKPTFFQVVNIEQVS